MSNEKSSIQNVLPEKQTWLRAAVSAIPYVGSPLDHLLFDKADSIRAKNIQDAIDSMSEQLRHFKEEAIDREWFNTEEAIAAFRLLAEKVGFEPDKGKVSALGKMVAVCGSTTHSKDPLQLSVLEHLSRLSGTQIRILSAVKRTEVKSKENKGGDLVQTVKGIWMSDIVTTLKAGPIFWEGTLALDQELEILESMNTIRRHLVWGPAEPAYELTAIGRRAADYVNDASM